MAAVLKASAYNVQPGMEMNRCLVKSRSLEAPASGLVQIGFKFLREKEALSVPLMSASSCE